MITGFNTDIEHEGVVYHVQTEDKGLDSPLILSLVYTGGAILASKRSPYDDLIASGFDEHVLAERLQRQHKLICAAIHAGRLEDLKRMTQRGAEVRAAQTEVIAGGPEHPSGEAPFPAEPTPVVPIAPAAPVPPSETAPNVRQTPGQADLTREDAARAALPLHVGLLEERDLRGGEFATLRVRVSRGLEENRDAVPDATVTVKILGTAFRPLISSARTDQDGIALVFAALPHFTTGRAAILIRVEADGHEAELRRIIHPA